jgi:microsomal epoxide hydrolase
MAEMFGKLMTRLGYKRYGTQGGDWGASISAWLGRNHPEQCVGVHLNFVTAGPPRGGDRQFEGLKPQEIARIRERRAFMADETGYSRIQGTKPQTLGYGLNDSPAGLAAWIVEKYRTWSDCDGDVEKQFTRDELLNNVMVYWVTGSITSSTRPRRWAETRFNVTHWTEMPRGGHFAAMEEPGLLVGDIRTFFATIR